MTHFSKHLLLAAAAIVAVPGVALAQSVEDRVEEVQEQANELREATNELNATVADERNQAAEDRTGTDRVVGDDRDVRDTAADDDDDDSGKWGLLGLLGLAGLLGLRRRDDHRRDTHVHRDDRTTHTDTDRRI